MCQMHAQLPLQMAIKTPLSRQYSKSDTKHLKYVASQTHLAWRVLWNDVYSLHNLRSKSQSLHLWMNELYHPLVFFASLEFKCMQRSKPPFRRKRWCNKQKPPDYAHSSPSATVTQLQRSSRTQRCFCKLPPGGRSAQECFLSLPLSLMPSFQQFVCLLRVNLDTCMNVYTHKCIHTYTEIHMSSDFLL